MDANTSSPQRLSAELEAKIVPAPPLSYNDHLDAIVLAFRVEAWRHRRAFQDEFYNLAKSIGRLAAARVHHA